MANRGKLIIFSAPSGSGKSTLISYLMQQGLPLSFSVSATSRAPRGEEQHGREYYFLSEEEFRSRIAADDFLEYEEVYPGKFYGTLKSEVERLRNAGRHVIFDVDVVGGVNIKQFYKEEALSIFIQPLIGRGTARTLGRSCYRCPRSNSHPCGQGRTGTYLCSQVRQDCC